MMRKTARMFVITVLFIFAVHPALGEYETSEIEKLAGFAQWLVGEAVHAQQEAYEEQQALDAMLWMYDDANPVSPDDVPEIAAVLTKLGIDGITDEHIGAVTNAVRDDQQRGYVCSRELVVLHLLSLAGMGYYDDDFVWYPSSDCVLYLDMELFGGDTLYDDFFKGLNAICGGDFIFSELSEDYAEADLEEGVGVIGLSFLANGKLHTADAMMMQDWFDPKVFNAAAEIAVHPQNGKRLYAMQNVAITLWNLGRKDEARETCCRLVEDYTALYGADHAETAYVVELLGRMGGE